jgi:hypothetical protein
VNTTPSRGKPFDDGVTPSAVAKAKAIDDKQAGNIHIGMKHCPLDKSNKYSL